MTQTAYDISTDFLECEERKLFAVEFHPLEQQMKGVVLFLHPFAEEMNKSRRTVAQQARTLAAAGYHVNGLQKTL